MKYNKLFILFIACLSFGCNLPTVRYFTIQPFITAYKTNIDKPLTIVFDPNVKDSILINSSDISKMKVVQFRRTLEDILKTTFKNTYTEVKMNNTFSQNGISLVLVKVKPDWKKKSIETITTGSGNNIKTTNNYELESKISYQAVVYSDGQKSGVIEGIVYSELSTFQRGQTPAVFKDGIKVMCEDIYKQIINYK